MTYQEKLSQLVDNMISYGEDHFLGIGRGFFQGEANWKTNIGPMWASNGPYPSIDQIKKEGMACVGLLALLLRKFHQPLPFLDENNFPDVCKNENWKDPKGNTEWHYPYDQGIQFGYGGTDEWMYIYQYVKKDKQCKPLLKPFDPNGEYPKGTLLFRVYNPYDFGHVAILRESSEHRDLMDCTVLHTGGDVLGAGVVTNNETVRSQHEMYIRGCHWNWDTDHKFDVNFGNLPYYTHVLFPEDYLNVYSAPKKIHEWKTWKPPGLKF